jgi:hypothetical protein
MSNSKIKEELKKEFDYYKQLKKEFIDLKHTESIKEVSFLQPRYLLLIKNGT